MAHGGKREGAGRKPGVPNKTTEYLKSLTQKDSEKVVKELVRLATKAKSEQTRVAAIKELLDRAYGRPSQALEHSGAEGAPLQVVVKKFEYDGDDG